MQSRLNDIHGANNEVLGVSADSPFSLAKWAEKDGYTFPLLSDFDKETITAYDVVFPELAGLKRVPKRAAFIIDRAGKVAHAEITPDAGTLPDIDALVDQMKAMG